MKLFDLIAENLFPQDYTCDVCGVETFDSNLCVDCAKKTPFNFGATCPVCGRRTVTDEICLECKDKIPPYKQGVSALVYEENAVILISKFKNGKGYLKEFFADILYAKVAILPPFDCIVYVPMLKKDVRRRGYNQGQLLAHALSKRTGAPVIDSALVKIKKNVAQKSLSQKERLANVAGCFKVDGKENIKDKTVLLVDDILTTGATAYEITKVLLKGGAKAVFLATVASVDYKLRKIGNASDV